MATVPKGRLRRLGRLAGLAPGLGGALLGGEALQRAVGERLLRTLGELKGGSMKLGQVLAQVGDALPEELRRHLEGLFERAPTLPWEEIEPVLDAELPGWREAVEVEPEPFAGASLGQVHRGRLADGRAVALKIQYPGVGEALRQDLANLHALAGLGTLGGAIFDVRAQLASIEAGLEAELDYRGEAAAGRSMAEALARWPDLVVPEPVEALCAPRVLVATLLEGPSLSQGAGGVPEGERAALSLRFARAVFAPIFAACRVNADAHPGNFVLLDGALGLLDFGAVQALDPAHVEGLRALFRAFLEDRQDRAIPALQAMGFGIDPAHPRVQRATRTLFGILRPVVVGEHDFGRDDTMQQLTAFKARHPLDSIHFVPPPDLIHVGRALVGLIHGLGLLGARVDLGPVLEELVAVGDPG